MRISGDWKLRLRPEFEIIPLAGSKVLLRSPNQGVRVSVDGLGARGLAALIRAMDGSRTVAALLDEYGLSGTVESLLDGLVTRDILDVDGQVLPSSDDARFFAQFHEDPAGCSRRLAESRVVVMGVGSLAECVTRSLRIAGVAEVTRVPAVSKNGDGTETVGDMSDRPVLARACRGADLAVACSERGGRSACETLMNEVALDLALTWLPVRIFAGEGFVGPLFVSGEGPCHACLLAREEANWVDPDLMRVYLERIAENPSTLEAYGRLPAFVALTSQWVVLEATKYLSRFTVPALLGHVLRIDFIGCRTQLHRVLRLPRCAQCSPAAHRPGVNGLLYARPE
ncbi:MAG: TOMM precursor leader peptide-binding protein [Deltaproteobacteria bacterium]|nr:TOMM precursor leader peptide-binding protein [Deltaproteobacteria bacterium]